MRSSTLVLLIALALAGPVVFAQEPGASSAAATGEGFVLIQNVEAVADVELSSRAGISGLICEHMCRTDANCTAFMHVLQNGECELKRTPVEKLDPIEHGFKSTVGIKLHNTKCPHSTFTRNEGLDSTGHNFLVADSISAAKCEELCSAFDECMGAVFVSQPAARCFLKNSLMPHYTTLPNNQVGFLTVKACVSASEAAAASTTTIAEQDPATSAVKPTTVTVDHPVVAATVVEPTPAVDDHPAAAATVVEPAPVADVLPVATNAAVTVEHPTTTSAAVESSPVPQDATSEPVPTIPSVQPAHEVENVTTTANETAPVEIVPSPANETAASSPVPTTTSSPAPEVSANISDTASMLAANSTDSITDSLYENMLTQYSYGVGKAACLTATCEMPTTIRTKEAMDAYIRGNTQCNGCLLKYWLTCRMGCHRARSHCAWVPSILSFGCVSN